MAQSTLWKNAPTLKWSSIPKQGAIYITGHRGTGKTALAWRIADRRRGKNGYPEHVAAYGFPSNSLSALPEWVRHVDSPQQIAALTEPHMIIIDESVFVVNSRRSQSNDNIEFTKLLAIIRHKGHLLIFISQSSRQIDIQLVEGFDMILIKKPSLLQVRTVRDAIKPEIEQAFKEFAEYTNQGGNHKKRVFMFDPHTGGTAMLPARMPDWWNDEVSRAYGEVTL